MKDEHGEYEWHSFTHPSHSAGPGFERIYKKYKNEKVDENIQNKTTSNTDYHTIGFESLTYDIKKHKYTAKEEKKFSGAILVTNSGGWLEEVVYRRNRRGEVRLWWFSNKPMIIRRRLYVANRLLNNTSIWSPE